MGSKSRILTMLPSLWLSFSFFIVHFSFLIASSSTATTITVYDGESGGSNNASIIASPSSPLAPPPQPLFKSKGSPLRPGVAVIVGVLTTVFSITFLLLLYAKHCGRGVFNHFSNRGYSPPPDRKNSGIDRAVIDSLPIFRFASLRGQKDGLECAVCLNIFESTEVLRLLPKCKHAFHVECVDTWLDAHSTCPLCRYRVDPEDILLVEDNRILYPRGDTPSASRSSASKHTPELGTSVSRVSGRHSFAGNTLQVIVETPKTVVARRSLDSWSSRRKRNSEKVDAGCFDRPRKDELLLADKAAKGKDFAQEQRRLEHRIIISGGMDMETDRPHHRWSDVQPSDLLFLQAEMILSDSHRFSGSTGFRPLISTRMAGEGSSSSSSSNNNNNSFSISDSRSFGGGSHGGISNNNHNKIWGVNGSNAINGRSVSEITGLSRFRSNDEGDGETEEAEEGDDEQQQQHRRQRKNWKRRKEEQRKRQEGAVSRWLAWISQSHFHNHQNHQQQQQEQLQQQPQQPHQPAVTGATPAPAASSSSAV